MVSIQTGTFTEIAKEVSKREATCGIVYKLYILLSANVSWWTWSLLWGLTLAFQPNAKREVYLVHDKKCIPIPHFDT